MESLKKKGALDSVEAYNCIYNCSCGFCRCTIIDCPCNCYNEMQSASTKEHNIVGMNDSIENTTSGRQWQDFWSGGGPGPLVF